MVCACVCARVHLGVVIHLLLLVVLVVCAPHTCTAHIGALARTHADMHTHTYTLRATTSNYMLQDARGGWPDLVVPATLHRCFTVHCTA